MSQTDNQMYYGATAITFEKAKALREKMTESELKLWAELNKSQLDVRFKPQHPIDVFIVDFYCHPAKLVIEIDGGVHLNPEQREWDANRTVVLEEFDLRIIRFTNEEVLENIRDVVTQINRELIRRLKK